MKYLLSFLFVGFSFVSLIAQTQIGSNIDGQLAGDKSGHSVSISGDGTVLAVAAPGHGYVGNQKGRVKVYQYSSGIWSQLGADIVGEAINDASGHSISLSGDGTVLAIGAPGNDDSGNQIGHVRVYEYNSGTWSQLGADIDGRAAGDHSGWSVSLSGDGTVLAIGAIWNGYDGDEAGYVRVYQYSSSTWSQVGLDIDGEATGDWSGESVSLSDDGTVVAIGAPNVGNVESAGYVRVYQYNSDTWSQLGANVYGEAAGERYGDDVSLSDNGMVLAIGAPGKENSGNPNGRVEVYEYNSGTWSQLGSDIIGEAAGDISGFAVSLSGDGAVLAIGAAGNDDSGIIAGHTRIYKYHSGAWSQIGVDIDGDAQGDQSGGSVSLSHDGTVVAIGAARNDENGNQAGRVKVYDLTHTTGIDDLTKYNPISIFPNPTKGYIYSEAFVTGDLIAVYNAVGKEVMHIENVSAKINVSNLNRGTYFILVISEHGIGYNNFLKL